MHVLAAFRNAPLAHHFSLVSIASPKRMHRNYCESSRQVTIAGDCTCKRSDIKGIAVDMTMPGLNRMRMTMNMTSQRIADCEG